MKLNETNVANDTNVANNHLNSIQSAAIRKAIRGELATSHSGKRATDSWQDDFIANIDEMVRSFLDFPPGIPQDFRDKQFARHLLWRVGDNRKEFALLFVKGPCATDFDFLWKRLMPFITGEAPDEVSTIDGRFMRLSIDLFKIIQDYIVLHESDFRELMDRTVHAIGVARYVNNE